MPDLTQSPNATNDVSYDDIIKELNGNRETPATPPANEPPVTPPVIEPPATGTEPPAAPATPQTPETGTPPDPNVPAPERSWYDDDPAGTQPPADPATQGTSQAVADPLYEKYASVLNNPEVQLILDLAKAGKSIFEIQKEITVVDFDSMKPAEIVAHDMKANGATDEQVADYLKNTFESKEVWEQNKEANALRPFYKSQQDQKIQNVRASAQATATQNAAEQQKKIEKTTQELKAYVSELPKKQVFGLQLSEADITRALNRFFGGYPELDNPDGTPNVQKRIDAAILYDNAQRIAKEVEKRATAKGAKEVAAEVTNANKGIPGSSGSTQSASTIEDAVKGMSTWLDK